LSIIEVLERVDRTLSRIFHGFRFGVDWLDDRTVPATEETQ